MGGLTGHRRCLAVRGTPEATRLQALALVEALDPDAVLWIAEGPEPSFSSVAPRQVRRLLGQAFDAVVLDLHEGVDADVLGQSHGFIWGGGALILRMPPVERPPAGSGRLAAHPHGIDAVGGRMYARLERRLAAADFGPLSPVRPTARLIEGTPEQAEVVDRLVEQLGAHVPSATVVLADRGRGKSAALGLALRELRGARIAVTAGNVAAVGEVFRFAVGRAEPLGEGPIRFVDPAELADRDARFDVIAVDEAAQLPVPLLMRIVQRHPTARLVFVTTARGYEGTGRGFVLRFLAWLQALERPLNRFTLHAPIRWDADDRLEQFVFDLLLLDAEPGPVPAWGPTDALRLDPEALAGDEAALRQYFGLLVHAHYRTTPGDLHRILDAPNLRLHALRMGGVIVAATLLAEEGTLPEAVCSAVYLGERRIRGHALAETLLSHSGRRAAGQLRMLRSVRIAVHPALRRRGLGTRLIDAVHASDAPDLFGTLFGATPELLEFRRAAGYRLVRVGASRGTRTGEPAAVMLRPVTRAAHALLDGLRADLARDLPLQLELMESGAELAVDATMRSALYHGLPAPTPLSAAAEAEAVAAFAFGPRTLESAAVAVCQFVERHAAALADLEPQARVLIEARVRARVGWSETMGRARTPSIPATMRALRRAVRSLVVLVAPDLTFGE